jgi:inositol-phosphate transport system substrate-binding protein
MVRPEEPSSPSQQDLSRAEFLRRTAAVAGGLALPGALAASDAFAARSASSVSLSAWSELDGAYINDLRLDALKLAAPKVKGASVSVDTTGYTSAWADYLNKYTLAAAAGKAPDIVVIGHENAAPYAEAGYIVPLDAYIKKYPEYTRIIDALWSSVTYSGKRWAVPLEAEARPMFWDTNKLAQLGWSKAKIAALPDQIEKGQWTLDDLVHTARLAIDKGVVPKQYAYWHRPQPGSDFIQYYIAYGGRIFDNEQKKLVVTRDALVKWYQFQRTTVTEELVPANFIGTTWDEWHGTVANDKVLFWNGGIWMWDQWKTTYIAGKGESYLFSFIDAGLQPSGLKGKPGVTLSHPIAYAVSSQKATGDNNQAVAAELIANALTKASMTANALRSGHLTNLKLTLDSPAYRRNKWLAKVTYMLNYAFYLPQSPYFGPYYSALYNTMVNVEQGNISPTAGADEAIATVKSQLPSDQVIFQ